MRDESGDDATSTAPADLADGLTVDHKRVLRAALAHIETSLQEIQATAEAFGGHEPQG